jgi:hypothetical protein
MYMYKLDSNSADSLPSTKMVVSYKVAASLTVFSHGWLLDLTSFSAKSLAQTIYPEKKWCKWGYNVVYSSVKWPLNNTPPKKQKNGQIFSLISVTTKLWVTGNYAYRYYFLFVNLHYIYGHTPRQALFGTIDNLTAVIGNINVRVEFEIN